MLFISHLALAAYRSQQNTDMGLKSSGAGKKCKNNVAVGEYNNCNPCCFENNGTSTGTKSDIIQENWDCLAWV